MRLPLWLSPKRRWWGLLIVLILVSAAWLLWSQERSERHLRQEPLVCKLPPPSSNAPRPGMVWVPGGDLALGDTVYAEESPVRQVPVAGVWLDRTEVTGEVAAPVHSTEVLSEQAAAIELQVRKPAGGQSGH